MITEKIYCKRLLYKDSVAFSNVNYFYFPSDLSNPVLLSNEKTELNHLSISKVKYDQSKVMSGDTLELLKKCNNVNIEFDNSLKSFFNIESTSRKWLYLFWVVWDNKTVFSGATNQEGIKYIEEPNNEKITIEVKSFLNHFLDYYSSVNCNITEMDGYFVFNRTFEISGAEYKSGYIENFFRRLFFRLANNFEVKNNTGYAWEINRQPFFYINSDNQYQFLTNGFRKIGAPTVLGQYETKTDFFVKLCNAMGWDFTLTCDFNSELTTLSIYNRYRTTIGISTTVNELASVNYNTEFTDSYVDYIVLRDGYIKSGVSYNTAIGIPIKIIDNKGGVYSNNGYFFKSGSNSPGSTTWNLAVYPSGEYYMIANSQSEGEVLEYGKVTYTTSNFNPRIIEILHTENRFILYIDAGENTYGSLVDLDAKIQDDDNEGTNNPFPPKGIYYKGSYGSMIFYRDGNYIRNYDYYSKTSTFKNNFLTLFQSKETDVIEVVFNKLFTDYYTSNYSQIVLTGGSTYLNAIWNITELELDLDNEQTKMQLKRA